MTTLYVQYYQFHNIGQNQKKVRIKRPPMYRYVRCGASKMVSVWELERRKKEEALCNKKIQAKTLITCLFKGTIIQFCCFKCLTSWII